MGRTAKGQLTAKQEKFAQHYAIHRSPYDAYCHAYETSRMSRATADVEAQKLLNHPKIAQRIAVLAAKVAQVAEKKFEITADRVLQEIAAIAHYDAGDFFDWGYTEIPRFKKNGDPVLGKDGQQVVDHEPFVRATPAKQLKPWQRKVIASAGMTISKTGEPVMEIKMLDKMGALKTLAQHLGLLKQDVNLSGKNGGPLMVVMSSAEANL